MSGAIEAFDPARDLPAREHAVHDYDSGPPVERARFAMWVFLASEAMFFAGLISLYLVYRADSSAWPAGRERLPLAAASFNTLVLLASSFTMSRAVSSARGSARGASLRWLGATLLLGTAFVSLQIWEYVHLARTGLAPHSDLFWSNFFVLTGLHGLHVTAGVLVLAVLWFALVRRGPSERFAVQQHAASLYWHFVDVVWIVLFTVLYWI